MWLRSAHVFEVSRFDLLRLVDVYRFEFESSMSTVASDESIRTVWMLGGWPRQHRYFLFTFCIWAFMLMSFPS